MRESRSTDDRIQPRIAVGDFPVPCLVYVIQRPRILERRAGCLAPDGSRVVLVRVEWRVEIDQFDRFGVHAPEDVEVVSRPYGAVAEVRTTLHGVPRGRGSSGAHAPNPLAYIRQSGHRRALSARRQGKKQPRNVGP